MRKKKLKKFHSNIKKNSEVESTSQAPEEEEEKSESVDFDEIKLKWSEFIDSIIDDMPVRANYLSNIMIDKVSKNQIICKTKSKLAFQHLNESKEELAELLSQFFDADLKLKPKFLKSSQNNYIHSPTLQDIKKNAPKIAKIMKKLDGYILRQEKK